MRISKKYRNIWVKLLILFCLPRLTYSQEQNSVSDEKDINDYESVYFTDDRTGFIVGENGVILKTTDKGINWIQKTSETEVGLNCVYFATTNTGYAVGDSGVILKTSNGGESWKKQESETSSDLTSIHCPNEQICYAVGGKEILRTANGGNDWIVYPGITGTLYSVFFPEVNTGFISGHQVFLRTTNSGETWEYLSFTTGFLFDVYFIDANTGWSVGISSIHKTANAGQDWDYYSPGNIILNSVYFPNPLTGYSVGQNGAILVTSNGGDSWKSISWDKTQNLNSVFCSDENLVFAVGDSGTILKISDGRIVTSEESKNQQEMNNFSVNIYPIPVGASINLESSAFLHQSVVIAIYDLNGRIVIEKHIPAGNTTAQFKTDGLTSGMYFCRINKDGNNMTKKFIVQK